MDVMNKLEAGVCRIDLKRGGTVIFGDEDFFRITGYTMGDISGGRLSVSAVLTDENRTATKELMQEAMEKHHAFSLRQSIIRKDGTPVFVHCCGDIDDDGVVRVIISECNCQSKLDHAYSELQREIEVQTEKLRMIAEDTEDIYFDYSVSEDTVTLMAGLTRYRTDGRNRIPNYTRGMAMKEFVHKDDYGRFVEEVGKALVSPCRGSLDFRTKAYDDDYTWYNISYVSFGDAQGKVYSVFGKLSSIQKIKNLANRIDKDSQYIQYLIDTDSLTGLLNRKGISGKAQEILDSRDGKSVYGVVYSDINDFSYVNENFGYEAGNEMLRDFAQCLKDASSYILSCRIYSDFFVGIYKAPTRDELIRSIEQRNISFTALQKERYPASDIRVSCGMYILPDDERDINTAIDNANLARRA